jgi:hypothetical protein
MNFLKGFVANLNLLLKHLPKPPKPRYRYNDDEAAIHRYVQRRKPQIVRVAVRRQHRLDRNRYRDLRHVSRERENARCRRRMAKAVAP